MANDFWTSAQVEPKRKYRFKVQISAGAATATALDDVIWFAKTVNKPEITVNTAETQYLGHKFYYPGTVEWNEISLTLVDPVSPDAANATLQMLTNMGYLGPKEAKDQFPQSNERNEFS